MYHARSKSSQMSSSSSRRVLVCGMLAIVLVVLSTAYHMSGLSLGSYHSSVKLEIFGSPADDATPDNPPKIEELGSPADDTIPTASIQVIQLVSPADNATPDPSVAEDTKPEISAAEDDTIPEPIKYEGPELGTGEVGKHFHFDLSNDISRESGVEGCEYPIVVHVTPDEHCTGGLALYGSIVRNVILQPALQGKTCVHFTYVDPTLKTVEEMYRWPARPNPFTHVPDCRALDTTPSLNAIVPVRFQALVQIEKPAIMGQTRDTWITALNKVHSWGFDLYPHILLLDADSMILTDLDLIFDDASPEYTVVGAPDQFRGCRDRNRINGGMILLKPSRYFHVTALERLYDEGASCQTGKWGLSEQELLNCICGTIGEGRGELSEFSCQIMPLYNSLWPRNYGCSAANVLPIRSIHFAAVPKPWTVEEDRLRSRFDYGFWACARDIARLGHADRLTTCEIPSLEITRTVPEILE